MKYLPLFFAGLLWSCSPSEPSNSEEDTAIEQSDSTASEVEEETKAVEKKEEPKEDADSLYAIEKGYLPSIANSFLEVKSRDVFYAYGSDSLRFKDTLEKKDGFKFLVLTLHEVNGEGDEGIDVIEVRDSMDQIVSRLYYYSGSFGDSFSHTFDPSLGDGDGLFIEEILDGLDNAEFNENGELTGTSFREEREHEFRYDSTGVLKFVQSSEAKRTEL
jgi:hypothetical protein